MEFNLSPQEVEDLRSTLTRRIANGASLSDAAERALETARHESAMSIVDSKTTLT